MEYHRHLVKVLAGALALALGRVPELGAQAPKLQASPIFSEAAARSGWAALRPSLGTEAARGQVRPLLGLGEGEFLERAWGLVLARDPETAYSYGISARYGIPEDALTDLSDEFALGTRELYLALAAETERRLGAAGAASAAPGGTVLRGRGSPALRAFAVWLRDKSRDIELSLDKYPVSPYVNSADNLALNYFVEIRQVRDAKEAARYVALLEKLHPKMEGLLRALELRAKAGVVLPRGILDATRRGIEEIAYASPRGNPFYDSLARKLEAAGVAGAERERLLDQAAAACERRVLPAWKALAEALGRQSSLAPAEGGAWSLPGGADYYAACLRRLTTTEASPQAIHELGLRELARVQAEMRARFKALGYPEGQSLAALYQRLGREGGGLAGSSLLSAIRDDIAAAQARMGEIVEKPPRIGVEAVFGPMGGYYQPPSADGLRPGRYFVAAGDRRWAFDVATTAYHETIPGHHLQIARALEADLPGFLRAADFLGYVEGWALYAERLASELGLYAKDPAGDLGRLRMEALRASRLVADTGVNAFGWSYGKALSFLQENTGLEGGILNADVMRYIVDPGQATAYYVGFVELLALREEAKAALGPGYDPRRFHELVLGGGALPLGILREEVKAWIAAGGRR